jgi:hypothetical protein
MVNLYTLRLELNWMSSRPTLHITLIKPSTRNKCDNRNLLIFLACSNDLKHLHKNCTTNLHHSLVLPGYPGWAIEREHRKESGLWCTHLQLAQMILLLYGIVICASGLSQGTRESNCAYIKIDLSTSNLQGMWGFVSLVLTHQCQ